MSDSSIRTCAQRALSLAMFAALWFTAPSIAQAVCGNGVINTGETCDDGNAISYDGCSNLCKVELCFTCPTAGQPCTRILTTGQSRPSIITPGTGIADYSVTYGAEQVCGPYMYSDFTGQQLRLASTLRGFYYEVFEGCMDGTPTTWGNLSWDAVLPSEQTRIAFRVRVADTLAGLSGRPWTSVALTAPATSPVDISDALTSAFITSGEGLNGRFLQLEVMLESDIIDNVFSTPELKTVTVSSTCSTPPLTTGTFTKSYSSADYCVSPEVPEWHALSYKVSTPSDSSVDFELRVANTSAGLDTAKPAIVSIPGADNRPDEGIFDTGKALRAAGLSSNGQYLRVSTVLKPSSDGTTSPIYFGYDQSWLCVFGE